MQHQPASYQNTQTFNSPAEGWMMPRQTDARSQHSGADERCTTGKCQQQITRDALTATFSRKPLA